MSNVMREAITGPGAWIGPEIERDEEEDCADNIDQLIGQRLSIQPPGRDAKIGRADGERADDADQVRQGECVEHGASYSGAARHCACCIPRARGRFQARRCGAPRNFFHV